MVLNRSELEVDVHWNPAFQVVARSGLRLVLPLVRPPTAVVGNMYVSVTAAGIPCSMHNWRTFAALGPVRAEERISHGSPVAMGGVPILTVARFAAPKYSLMFGARTARWYPPRTSKDSTGRHLRSAS